MNANELADLLKVDSWYKLVTREEITTMLRQQQVRIEQLLETQNYLYKRHDEQQADLKDADKYALELERLYEDAKAEIEALKRPNNVVGVPCDELKKMQDQLAHLKKMIVWYQDITMTGINSTDYENGFWDAVNFVKSHQVKDKN